MLSVQVLETNGKYDWELLKAGLDKLKEQGWLPALLEANRTFLRLAGVEPDEAHPIRRRLTRAYSGELEGEVFFVKTVSITS